MRPFWPGTGMQNLGGEGAANARAAVVDAAARKALEFWVKCPGQRTRKPAFFGSFFCQGLCEFIHKGPVCLAGGTVEDPISNYYPIFIYLVAIIGFVVTTLILAHLPWLKPGRDTPVKSMPYESGMDPFEDARQHFDVKFYLIAILFLLFDIELLFLYPWAVSMYAAAGGIPVELRDVVFWATGAFLLMVAVAYVYEWRRGGFKWR
jgi:NADH-quinone oxidoreductase subunit A